MSDGQTDGKTREYNDESLKLQLLFNLKMD